MRPLLRLAASLCLALVLLVPALAEDTPGGPPPAPPPPTLGDRLLPGQPLDREGMWPAPTAEDWARPCLLHFERTWDDAVAVAEETGKPILVCINMDGEIASEHYAGVRYRQPEIAALYQPYVCVIASVYRHTPRDYDEQGNRILCPRFGSVTCGEHIGIEPVIYEKFCEGQRIAPRHIMVDLEGKEVYDVFYTNDTASVFDAVRSGPAKVTPPKPPIVRGDRPVVERVQSRAAEDRDAVEKAYRDGDKALRAALLEAAAKHAEAAPLDLVRLAVFGLDVDLSRKARAALAETKDAAATTLVSEALQVPMEGTERDALIGALKRLGETSVLARWLAGVHQGLFARSKAVDVEAWTKKTESLGGGTYGPPRADGDALGFKVEDLARTADERPQDPESRLQLAEATLTLASEAGNTWAGNPRMARRVSEQAYADARRAAEEALALGAKGWRVAAVLALSAYYLGDLDVAYARAAEAMKELPAGDEGWTSMAVVTVFAESRWKAIKAAVKDKQEWPAEWLSDLHAAYAVLQRHPLGTDGQVVWHYEFLKWLGAEHRAERVLEEGLSRFTDSDALHQRLRDRLLEQGGPDALEAAYAERVKQAEDPGRMLAFAGVASVAAAESARKARAFDRAREAYGHAVEHFEEAVAKGGATRESADRVIALALAGRARVAYQVGDLAGSAKDVLAALARAPDMAGTRDGMGITPGETAQMLLRRLATSEHQDLARELAVALAGVDPELLNPDR
jgi:tetratricopeptide (TPR) repeat protein